MSNPLLQVENLKVHYPVKSRNRIGMSVSWSKAVDGVSFSVDKGETFGIVGESGCGKSTTGKAIVGLLNPTEGSIRFNGTDITEIKKRDLAKHIQMIFQDPFSSLDPRFPIGRTVQEPLVVHRIGTAAEQKAAVNGLLQDVGMREDQSTFFPHEFSGGQRQRIGVARAIALHPDLVICDEPVSALDVSIQAQILNLMKNLQNKYDLTYIFISHNLGVVKHMCDRIAVMYLGHMVEQAKTADLFSVAFHPYTKALFDAIPIADPDVISMTSELEGDVPSPLNPPSGCCFHKRCPQCFERCLNEIPQLKEQKPGHAVACHLFD